MAIVHNQSNIKSLIKTARRWNIPDEVALEVIKRDPRCIYCGCEFDDAKRTTKASWEHVINDIRLNSSKNIALSCVGCNASKGTKELAIWIESDYAKRKGITYVHGERK